MARVIIKKVGDEPMIAIINDKEFPIKKEFDFKFLAHQTYFNSMPKGSYLDVVSALAEGIEVDPSVIEIQELDCEPWCRCSPCTVNCQEPTCYAIYKPETK